LHGLVAYLSLKAKCYIPVTWGVFGILYLIAQRIIELTPRSQKTTSVQGHLFIFLLVF